MFLVLKCDAQKVVRKSVVLSLFLDTCELVLP